MPNCTGQEPHSRFVLHAGRPPDKMGKGKREADGNARKPAETLNRPEHDQQDAHEASHAGNLRPAVRPGNPSPPRRLISLFPCDACFPREGHSRRPAERWFCLRNWHWKRGGGGLYWRPEIEANQRRCVLGAQDRKGKRRAEQSARRFIDVCWLSYRRAGATLCARLASAMRSVDGGGEYLNNSVRFVLCSAR